MRQHTEPGVAPPAPGSVGPRSASAPSRAGTYAHTQEPVIETGWTDPDDVPTKPDNAVQPELLQLVRLVDAMPPVERRRFIGLAASYQRCSLGRRVLIEEMARELAVRKEQT